MYLTQSLHRNLRHNPNGIAILDRQYSLTYQQFGERVAKLAGGLRELGVTDGKRVAIMSLNSSRFIEYTMAVPWAGGALNPVNIRWAAKEVAYSLDDSKTSILLVDDSFLPLLTDIKNLSTSLQKIIYVGDGETPTDLISYEQLLAESDPVEDAVRRGDDIAGIFYTGGTTGFPKGVMLSHNNLCTSTVSIVTGRLIVANDRFLHAAPMFHIADFGMMLAVFMVGGTHVIVPRFEPQNVLNTIEQHRVSNTLLVPTMLQMLLTEEDLPQRDLSSIHHIIYGASPMPLAVLKRAMTLMPDIGFIQAYGMTELSPIATFNGRENHTPEGIENGLARAAGLPGMLQEVKVVDEQGKEVLRNTVGEVVVRGQNVMLGYWGKPEATAEAIRDGWMHTGDGGYMDDNGYLYIVDRMKDMIISGGENIYSAEVENAILQHPAIAQCAVIGIPSEQWGETVHAVLVAEPEASIDLDQLRQHCRSIIAGYKCPSSMVLVNELPLSGAGKILKVELRKEQQPE